MQVKELRSIDAGHEIVQVFTDPFEQNFCESRKDSACRGGGSRLPGWGEIKGIGIQAVGTGGWSTQ